MLSIRRLAWAALVLAAANTVAFAQNDLRWKWTKGRKLKASYQQRIDSETTVNRLVISMVVDMNMDMAWTVQSVDSDGLATVELKIDRLSLKLESPDKAPIVYDSTLARQSKAGKSIAESVGGFVGVPFQMVVTPRGKVERIEWTEKAEAAIAKAAENKRVANVFTKEAVTKMMQQSATPLPDQAVEKGAKWNRERTFDAAFGKVTQTNHFEFRGDVPSGLQRIVVAGDLMVDPKKDAKGRLKSHSLNGEILFDNQMGMVRESTLTQKLESERPYRDTLILVKSHSKLKLFVTDVTESD